MVVAMLCCQLAAQELIKKDLMPYFDNVPPLPVNVQGALAKVTIDNAGASRYHAQKIYGDMEKEVKELESTLAQQMKSASMAAAPPGAPASTQDPEMKKKMKQMSPEEKQKFALEMMKSMQPDSLAQQPESPALQNALAEWQKINTTLTSEYQQSVEWQQAEIAKLLQINYGEMSSPDPGQVKVVKLKANDRHIAQADQTLKQTGELWKKITDHKKALYTPFYQKLVAADYATGYQNFTTFKLLSDAQIMIIKDLSQLIGMSRTACEESAQWQGIRQEIEKE